MTYGRLAAVAALSMAGSELGLLTRSLAGPWELPTMWPPAGVILAGILAGAARPWATALAGVLAVLVSHAGIHREPVAPSLALAVLTGVEAFAASWLLRVPFRAYPFALDRPDHVWKLAAAAFVVPLAGGALAAAVVGQLAATPFEPTWVAWWLADALGILTAAPAALALLSAWPPSPGPGPWRIAEAAAIAGGTTVTSIGVFGGVLPDLLQAPSYVLPFILWAVFRFGPGGTAASILAVTLVGLWNTVHGQGPFVPFSAEPSVWVYRAQGVGSMVGLSFLLLASIVAERKRSAQERADLVTELQQALAQVKTLEGFIPICAWCHRVRDDEGFWQRIESYLQDRTDARFSHSICPSCTGRWHGTTDTARVRADRPDSVEGAERPDGAGAAGGTR